MRVRGRSLASSEDGMQRCSRYFAKVTSGSSSDHRMQIDRERCEKCNQRIGGSLPLCFSKPPILWLPLASLSLSGSWHSEHRAFAHSQHISMFRHLAAMSIPNEKLQQLLQEIEQKAAFAQQQLGTVRAQIASKNREKRMLQLSDTELDALPKETPVYDGVGKMFVLTSTEDVKKRQSKEATDVKAELENLEKKLHYLETTLANSQQHMDAIFKRGV
ncbi:hypothetical protein AC579_7926 [Pseudocercospora musae]|uniref:Prefoldin subunit 1 n=1 Tax=Pseudocercospora musae TaxID=113226 RepID=A0A139IKH4_9PEZI|nr:hypothetical protein AC579_7926 [Pseudocercospora musae]